MSQDPRETCPLQHFFKLTQMRTLKRMIIKYVNDRNLGWESKTPVWYNQLFK